MPAQKKVSAPKSKQSKKRVRSMGLGLAVMALLMVGVVSAMALSQQSQDSRSSAKEGTICRYDNNAHREVCETVQIKESPVSKVFLPLFGGGTKPMTQAERDAKERADKIKAAVEADKRANKIKAAVEADKINNEAARKAKEVAQKAAVRSGAKTQAQVDAENVADAQAKKAQDANKNSGATTPTTGGNGGTSGGSNAAVSPEVAYTQQIYRELIGWVPPTSDKDFNTLVGLVRENNCLAVVQAFNHNETFKQRKQSYSNLDYARMIHRVLVSRNMSPNDASNGWVSALNNGMTRDQLVTSIAGFEEPKAACAARRLIAN